MVDQCFCAVVTIDIPKKLLKAPPKNARKQLIYEFQSGRFF